MENTPNTGGIKAFGAIVGIAAIIGGVGTIVRPMQQQIDVIHQRMERIENRIENQIENLDEKLQIEITAAYTEHKEIRANIIKLEDWLVWWYKNVPQIDAIQSEKLKYLERQLEESKEIE